MASWWNPLSWGGGVTGSVPMVVSPGQGSGSSPDLSEFMRSSWTTGTLTLTDVCALGAVGAGCTPSTRAEWVPLEVLDAIGFDPIVYCMERVLLSPAQDPELYYLRGDVKACAEVEAWLRPLLTVQRSPLLAQVTRAFCMGSVPIVFDYEQRSITFSVPRDGTDGGSVNRTLKDHVHYVRSHEVWPGEASLRVNGDRLLGLLYLGDEIGGEDLDDPGRARAFLSIWDPSFGRWTGQGSRRRVYKDWIEGGMARLWEMRALERVVDPARIGYAPNEDIDIGGSKIAAVKLLRAQMLSLRNGSVMTLPGTLDANGNPLWRLEAPFTPGQGHEIAKQAIDARDVRKAWACLSPGGPVDKATEEQFMDSVQSVCDFVASFLTRVVRVALRLRYGDEAPFVQVLANDIPKRKLRTATQVFTTVASLQQRLPDGRVYTLGELVDPEILDQLGVKARPVADAAHEDDSAPDPSGPVGRPLDMTGEREQRRGDAATVDGEVDTGGVDGAGPMPMDRQPQAGG